VAGLSFVEPLLTALEIDALDGLQIFDALAIVKLIHPPIMPDLPALIAQVYSREVASDLKLVLMNQYPDEYEISLIEAAGTSAQAVRVLPLYEMDRYSVGPLTSLYLPPLPSTCSFEGFQETIARLRSPEGCPWDREQTHKSLRNNLLEETYEVIAAIDAEDQGALREELGDLLLQIVLQTQIAIEYGDFQMPEVIAGIDAKLKRRHPHVWGDIQVNGAGDVCRNWEAIKRAERESEGEGRRSLLDGIPKILPALAQAYAYGNRAANVGIDKSNIDGIVDHVQMEIAALTSAHDLTAQVRKLGDLLFAVVDWARKLNIDPESALRGANLRFAQKLKHLETVAYEHNTSLQHMDGGDLKRLWQEAEQIFSGEKA
jgi:tetrapyrrole methylase family protein/MazG family protein